MEYIAPPLNLCLHLLVDIKNGVSVRISIENFSENFDSQFSMQVKNLVYSHDQNTETDSIVENQSSPYRSALMQLILLALKGQPILESLTHLKQDIEKACDAEVQQCLQLLPYKMLIPTMIFMIPAYLLTLFGPIVRLFLEGILL